jgi:radical SAM protein with 4Fe4S-binding SPASM domain
LHEEGGGEVNQAFVSSIALSDARIWENMGHKRIPISFGLELTARCNHNCRHCYINLPAGEKAAKGRELSFEEIKELVDEAVSLGALWCLITGGEPLLRGDFLDIYLYLKKKGLLISLFTNASLITKDHVELFKAYPPRNIEVCVYGATRKTYEGVTRTQGSYASFLRGLEHLLKNRIPVRLKTMALRTNFHEMEQIGRFCRERTCDYFRFDPFLHLRLDGEPKRNDEIRAERLSPSQIESLEHRDKERFDALKRDCGQLINPAFGEAPCRHVFTCGAGLRSFFLTYEGRFRLCPSLSHPDCTYDVKQGNLTDAWQHFVGLVRKTTSERDDFLIRCGSCPLINLCMWCPAYAYLETGSLDTPVAYFCEVAHARAKALGLEESTGRRGGGAAATSPWSEIEQ